MSSSGSRANNSYLGRKITHGNDESSRASLRLSSYPSRREAGALCHQGSKTQSRTKLSCDSAGSDSNNQYGESGRTMKLSLPRST